MHPLTLLYTKLSSLSNDRSDYINLFDLVRFFCGKIWGFLFKKNRKNRLCFSCYNIDIGSPPLHTGKALLRLFKWI